MAFLELRNIGKIYVSENSIAVGIRGVSLDFDLGEFVAVTGKSGSGKTTLLNCISGMDSYEEGEIYIDGGETSHYTQADWEEYRQKYISFIFQDYNIIDSFTVLQNVELALTHIDSRAERRRRALELIERVGMTSHKNSKGSKLSGGQKQRTVIARALAKDSPIILADEPTGNLDSKTGEEIVELLAEIGREKLVIVVTHSAQQFEGVATRQVRIFDGGVEKDEHISRPNTIPYVEKHAARRKSSDFRLGMELGRHKFFASPKLSVFMCLIMVIAMIGCFFTTSLFFAGNSYGNTDKLFTYVEGRLVISKQKDEVITDEELETLKQKLGAEDYIHYDHLFERADYLYDYGEDMRYLYAQTKVKIYDGRKPDVGRAPEREGECMLSFPIAWQSVYGKDQLLKKSMTLFSEMYRINVVGVDYYYDNSREYAEVLVTSEGFDRLTDLSAILSRDGETTVNVRYTVEGMSGDHFFKGISIDDSLKGREFYYVDQFRGDVRNILNTALKSNTAELELTKVEWNTGMGSTYVYNMNLANGEYKFREDLCRESDEGDFGSYATSFIVVSPEMAGEIADEFRHKNYTQASLFFDTDKEAEAAKEKLSELGYAGMVSNEEYVQGELAVMEFIETSMSVAVWILSILFLAFFLSLCSIRVLAASNSDLAIMRSMGISNKIVKISMYSRMLISVVPALVVLGVTAPVLFTNPVTNNMFPFLHAEHYILIVVGLVALNILVTRRCNKRIFRASVIKTLKGGEKS